MDDSLGAQPLLRVSKREQPDLYEQIEDTLFSGEGTLELRGETFEIVSSELSLGDDAAFLLAKLS